MVYLWQSALTYGLASNALFANTSVCRIQKKRACWKPAFLAPQLPPTKGLGLSLEKENIT